MWDERIREVGNKTGIPNSIYNKALARYEESLEAPLNKAGRVYDRTSMEKNDGAVFKDKYVTIKDFIFSACQFYASNPA